jgi:ABC-2 type transport system permease protein
MRASRWGLQNPTQGTPHRVVGYVECGCAYTDAGDKERGDRSLRWTQRVVTPENKAWLLAPGFLLSGACFAILGILLSSPPTDKPSEIMMLSNLVRLPLIFFSGVFLPLEEMPTRGQWIAPISPLTYCTELLRYGFGGATRHGPEVGLPALLGFALLFWVMSVRLHRRSMSRRIWA